MTVADLQALVLALDPFLESIVGAAVRGLIAIVLLLVDESDPLSVAARKLLVGRSRSVVTWADPHALRRRLRTTAAWFAAPLARQVKALVLSGRELRAVDCTAGVWRCGGVR